MSVKAQSAMGVETLSAVPEANLSYKNNMENGDPEEDYNLHLPGEDTEEVNAKGEKAQLNSETETLPPEKESTTGTNSSSPDENEDDILDKFENTDNANAIDNVDDKLEDKLLNECEELENETKHDDDGDNDDAEKEEGEKKDKETTLKNDSETSLSNIIGVKDDIKINGENNVKISENNCIVPDTKNNVSQNEEEHVENNEKMCIPETEKEDVVNNDDTTNMEEDQQQKAKDDNILKEQIMDTEDLLQIIDKEETEETYKEGSSSGNSPRSAEDDGGDTDKMDVGEFEDEEAEKMECEEEEQNGKDDGVDIEESSPLKDCDVDIDEEYNDLEANADTDESLDSTAKTTDETSAGNKDATGKTSSSDFSEQTDIQSTEKDDTEMKTDRVKETKESKEVDSSSSDISAEADNKVNAKVTSKSAKRSLTNSDIKSDAKKIKLTKHNKNQTLADVDSDEERSENGDDVETDAEEMSEPVIITDDQDSMPPSPKPIKMLTMMENYLKTKTLKRLTYNDLEQLVVQKICEVMCYKSELGELRQQLAMQEQLLEMWRKEVIQLNKQTRDLEIVHKRTLHEVRTRNEKDKPLIPVRITRSVGLQVRMDNAPLLNNANTLNNKRPALNRRQVPQTNMSPTKQQQSAVRNNTNNNQINGTNINTVNKVNNNSNNSRVTPSNNKSNSVVTKKIATVSKTVPSNNNNSNSINNSSIRNVPPIKPITMKTASAATIVPQSTNIITTTASTSVSSPTNTTTSFNKSSILPTPKASAKTASILPTPKTSAKTASILPTPKTSAKTASILPTPKTSLKTASILAKAPAKTASILPKTSAKTTSILSTCKTLTKPASSLHTPKPLAKIADPKAVIDLTDEDDKSPAASSSTPNQAVRIVSAPVKTTSVTTTNVVNPPRIMYVYNNQLHQGVLATDPSKAGSPKLMLKLNTNMISPANNVLAAVSTNSTVAVSSTPARSSQVQPVRITTPAVPAKNNITSNKHPAPLPLPPANQAPSQSRKPIPPKPHLSIKRSDTGLILSWKMPYNLDNYEAIASYQLYAYQETTSPPSPEMWRKVGDVKALALPMACTLTQFADGNKYHFAVRAMDVLKRMGSFSDPEQILL